MLSINGSEKENGGVLKLDAGDFDYYPFHKALYWPNYKFSIDIKCVIRPGDLRENLISDMKKWKELNAVLQKSRKQITNI